MSRSVLEALKEHNTRVADSSSRENGVLKDASQAEAYMLLRSEMDYKYRSWLRSQETATDHAGRVSMGGVTPNMMEVMRTDDAAILFRRIVQDMIIEPDEPTLIAGDLFPEIAITNTGVTVEVFLTDAIEAQIVGESEPLKDSSLDFEKARYRIEIITAGVQIALTRRMLEEDNWDLMGRHFRAAGNALARLKEEYIWTMVQQSGRVVFDNTGGSSELGTTHGVGADGSTANYTMTHLDFIDLIAGLLNHKKTPTDCIYHPIAWAGLLKDPAVRDLINQTQPKPMEQPLPNPNAVRLPYAINPHMVPWVNTNQATKAQADPYKTDFIVLDKTKSAMVMNRQKPVPTQWEDPRDDMIRNKWLERYGVGIVAGGVGIAIAKQITADANYGAPLPIYKTIALT